MNRRIAVVAPVLVLLGCSFAVGQEAARDAPPKPAYIMIDYMQVPEDGDELYLKVEGLWEKIHEARRELGLVLHWAVCRVERTAGSKADYNYVVVHVVDSWADLENPIPWDKIEPMVSFSDEENEILNQTGESRKLLRSDIWAFDTVAVPDRFGQGGFDPTFTIGFMKSERPGVHRQLEREVFSKLWAQAVESGHRWNWSLWQTRVPSGTQSPYNTIAIHTFPEGKADVELPGGWGREAFGKAFPEEVREEMGARLGTVNELREMVAVEKWTIVESLGE